MTYSRLNVQLHRDSYNTQWGFRLQGGKDLDHPLAIQRVFSSSPAEGELQRGDIILSINNRDASQLTHKEAQDYIKHGGLQLQLVISRPPPGTYADPLSPPVIYNSLRNQQSSTPASRPTNIQMSEPSFYTSYNGPYQQTSYKPPNQPLHVYASPGPQYQHGFDRQRGFSQPPSTPTPTTPVPPWASQQVAPKRVSKLSKLGGGGFNFGSVYATLPRGSSVAQYAGRSYVQSQSSVDGQEEPPQERLATGPIPKVCRLRNLGGGGYDFGSSFGSATLPRHSAGRRLSQPVKMPSAGGYVYQTSNAPSNRYGGGGSQFGSDFGQKAYGQTPSQREQTNVNVRSQEASNYQQSYQQQNSQPYQSRQQQVYTPTALLLEQQRLQEQKEQEEGGVILPVWERRKQFQQGSSQKSEVRTPLKQPAPKISKPQPGPTSYASFGTDYSRSQGQQSTSALRPASQTSPTYVQTSVTTYTPVQVQYTQRPAPPSSVTKPSPPTSVTIPIQLSPPSRQRQGEEDTDKPLWRNTLRSTGVKPWEYETGYAIEQQPVSKPSPSVTKQSDDRDWSQSAVLRYISQDDSGKSKPSPPAVAPKPQISPVQQTLHQHSNYYDEIAASDF